MQLEEEAAPVCDCAVPAAQLTQLFEPVPLWKKPAPHAAQLSDPGPGENIPEAH